MELQLNDFIILENGNEFLVQTAPHPTKDGTMIVSCFSYDGDYEWESIEVDSPEIKQVWRNKVLVYEKTPPASPAG